MTVKHFIITRFLSEDFNHSEEELFSDEWLTRGRKVLEKHFIPTLENQTCRDFEVVFLIHDNIPAEKTAFLEDVECSFPTHVIRRNALDDFLDGYRDSCDVMVTSRFDYDDNIHKEVVECLRRFVDDNPDEVSLWGLTDGAVVIDGENTAHRKRKQKWEIGGLGLWAAMESLVLPKKRCERFFSVYRLGNHTSSVQTLKEQYKELGISSLRESFAYKDQTGEVMYLWVRTAYSQTVLVQHRWHDDGETVELDLKGDFAYAGD